LAIDVNMVIKFHFNNSIHTLDYLKTSIFNGLFTLDSLHSAFSYTELNMQQSSILEVNNFVNISCPRVVE
jgi:hypothetical protein